MTPALSSPRLTKNCVLAGLVLLALCAASSTAEATSFVYTGSLVPYTILSSGFYDLTAAGGQGGGAQGGGGGGAGAVIGTVMYLPAGTTLEIAVGGAGGSGNFSGYYGGGGGGGSFVLTAGYAPLIVAGGAGYGGFNSGGFGGGGGGGTQGGGGGGGFSGGGGGDGQHSYGGGGAGSYVAPGITVISQAAGANYGYGYVTISRDTNAPEPATLALFASAIGTLGLLRRRRAEGLGGR